jgi:large conductance mechanosensitive channel
VKKLLEEFKDFINQGNLIELAVAFILGLAIKSVIDSLVNDVVMPIIGAIFGKPSFDALTLKIGDGVVFYGRFLSAIINFLIIAVVIFFMVKIYEKLVSLKGPKAEEAKEQDEKDVLIEIRDLLAQQNRQT